MSFPTPPTTPSHPQERFKNRTSPSAIRHFEGGSSLLTPPTSPVQEVLPRSFRDIRQGVAQKRQLSDNELSYYLPSRQDGVNDMYLHHRLSARGAVVNLERILYVWAYQLVLHQLLSSQIHAKSYEEVSFHHTPASTLSQALGTAQDLLVFLLPLESESELNLVDDYLNGPRTLSNERLSVLYVRRTQKKGSLNSNTNTTMGMGMGSEREGEMNDWEFMLTATHFLGDGMALHTFMNDFYTILGSNLTNLDIRDMISRELEVVHALPPSLEDRLSIPPARNSSCTFARAVEKEEYNRSERLNIGGQGFPGPKLTRGRKTVVPTFAYSEEETKTILKRCKSNGVTIAHAVFALCNIAWARRTTSNLDPCLIYSALNLRQHMAPFQTPLTPISYFHLAVGYFNIILPTLLPSSISTCDLLWHRARSTKSQMVKNVNSRFVISRFKETSKVRKERSVKWAKVDDEEIVAKKGVGLGFDFSLDLGEKDIEDGLVDSAIQADKASLPTPPPSPMAQSTMPNRRDEPVEEQILPAASQRALMGLSMLGNLDGMYKHSSFPDLRLEALTTGSRQRSAGLLLFAYTFTGKLWLSLGYDVNGFEEGSIEGFWEEVQSLVREVLL